MNHRIASSPSLLLLPCLILGSARAGEIDYGRDIQPVLAEHCFHCHGKDEAARKSGLRLDLREAALLGGESDGPAITPGDPAKSAILARLLAHEDEGRMPPPEEKNPVNPADIEKLRQWIKEGAQYSGHWAFEPPQKPPLPAGSEREHPVDAFIKARLSREGLAMSPPASAETICRRLHLDLIGLPPTPAELDHFARDVAERGLTAAASAKADRLLADWRYAEKWARHWLDVARYSDTNGFEKDLPREQWIWRDWVIDALNRDLPYDQFIIEQIAGDLLPGRTQEQLVATGFLRNSMINEEGAIVPEEWRMEAMFDRMDAVGSGVLGLSLKCAQCHTHKFDPISHEEYYGLFSFLNNTYEAQSWVYSKEQTRSIEKTRQSIAAVEKRIKVRHKDWEQKLAAWEAAEKERWNKISWTIVKAEDTHSSTELNHPAVLPDGSILTLGHRTISGDVHLLAKPELTGVTGIRLEVLTHGDLPFGGPGRSYKGTWALSELVVEVQRPGSKQWERLRLVNATSDFEEASGKMEPEWENKSFDKDQRRVRGPVAYMVDCDDKTAWRADRGVGRRNTESVAVAQFEKPVTLPPGTTLKVALVTQHGGDDNGPKNTQVGRFRVALTQSPDPKIGGTAYTAVLAMQVPPERRTAQQKQAIFDAWRLATPQLKPLNDEIDKEWSRYPEAITSVLHLAERSAEDARETRRLDRGLWNQGKEVVQPRVPKALHPIAGDVFPSRLAFAKWLVDRRSPLTARVAVNRVWQALFGIGIVETAEDFGTRAAPPSHRELLDWLAVDFMEQGWSQKQLLRRLVTSAAYLQSSHVTPQLAQRDPKNRLLARGPRFRVEAEVLRDIALCSAGLLAEKQGGPSVFPPMPPSVLDLAFFKPDYWKPAEDATRYARALYVFRKRSMPDPALTALDAPTGDTACTRRPRSNSPLAALTAMNEPIFVEAAQGLAIRVLLEGGKDDVARANYAFRLCTSRAPTESERRTILELLASRRDRLRRGELKAGDIAFSSLTKLADLPPDATPNDIAAWAIVSRVLLNLDETLTKN